MARLQAQRRHPRQRLLLYRRLQKQKVEWWLMPQKWELRRLCLRQLSLLQLPWDLMHPGGCGRRLQGEVLQRPLLLRGAFKARLPVLALRLHHQGLKAQVKRLLPQVERQLPQLTPAKHIRGTS